MSNYILLRLVICIIVFIIIILKSKKSVVKNNKNKKKWLITRFILCYICFVAMYFVPFENLFYTFPTAESAFRYVNSGTVLDIAYGKESCMAICSSGTANYSSVLLLKSKNGYKIDPNFNGLISEIIDEATIQIYNKKGTKDYYILALYISVNDNDVTFGDNRNSQFRKVIFDDDKFRDYKYEKVYVLSYVYNIDNKYKLFLNEREVNLNIK